MGSSPHDQPSTFQCCLFLTTVWNKGAKGSFLSSWIQFPGHQPTVGLHLGLQFLGVQRTSVVLVFSTLVSLGVREVTCLASPSTVMLSATVSAGGHLEWGQEVCFSRSGMGSTSGQHPHLQCWESDRSWPSVSTPSSQQSTTELSPFNPL